VARQVKRRSAKAKPPRSGGGKECHAVLPMRGVVAFKRAGDPNVGEFSDAVVLKKFGDVPERFERAVIMVLLLRHAIGIFAGLL
jgi:hypothetical protein